MRWNCYLCIAYNGPPYFCLQTPKINLFRYISTFLFLTMQLPKYTLVHKEHFHRFKSMIWPWRFARWVTTWIKIFPKAVMLLYFPKTTKRLGSVKMTFTSKIVAFVASVSLFLILLISLSLYIYTSKHQLKAPCQQISDIRTKQKIIQIASNKPSSRLGRLRTIHNRDSRFSQTRWGLAL